MTTPTPGVNPTTGTQITTSQPAANGSTGLWTQPPFDSRIASVTWPMLNSSGQAQQLQRGFMIWDTSNAAGATGTNALGYAAGTAAQVNFLFNPSQVTAQYGVTDASVQSSTMLPVAGDPSKAFIPLQQTVEFALLFDRTYEMWSLAGNPNTNPGVNPATALQTIGVDVDVRAMRQFTGMTSAVNPATTQTPGGAGGAAGTGIAPGTPGTLSQGIMIIIPSFVYFGAPGTGISFYGFVSEWDVTYTHFSATMVPIRAAINVTFTLLPPTGQVVTPATSVFSTGNTTGTIPGVNFPTTGALPTAGIGGR